MREMFKDVKIEIDDKEYLFRIKKMDVFSTSGMIKFLVAKIVPGIKSFQEILSDDEISENTNEEDVKKISAQRTMMILEELPKIMELVSEKELVDLEKKCLKTVSVVLAAGEHPVFINNEFGLEELEYETAAVLMLCYEVITFNVKGFFGESSLSSALKRLITFQPKL